VAGALAASAPLTERVLLVFHDLMSRRPARNCPHSVLHNVMSMLVATSIIFSLLSHL